MANYRLNVSITPSYMEYCVLLGLPGSGKNMLKMSLFQVREKYGWSGKFGKKNLDRRGKVRKFVNKW